MTKYQVYNESCIEGMRKHVLSESIDLIFSQFGKVPQMRRKDGMNRKTVQSVAESQELILVGTKNPTNALKENKGPGTIFAKP